MRKLPPQLKFLYMPDDNSHVRQFTVHRALLYGSGVAFTTLLLVAGLYIAGLVEGSAWRPGGSHLARENESLALEIAQLESRIGDLEQNLEADYELQTRMAEAVDLESVDPTVWQAGVGGREPLYGDDGNLGQTAAMARHLDKLLRQARIQQECYESLVDSLAERQEYRSHLPSIRPLDVGWLSSSYGKRKDPFTGKLTFHHGLDYSVRSGTPVRVTADGTVVQVINDRYGFGRMIKVDHGNGIVTIYAHLSKYLVKDGQEVHRGDVIAESGNSGRSTGPHLHYEVRVNKRRVNPAPWILDSFSSRS